MEKVCLYKINKVKAKIDKNNNNTFKNIKKASSKILIII